jgi:Fic family protein
VYSPDYQITPTILKYISQIEAAKAIIASAPLLPLYERQFKTEATARKVHFSTAIEGNYLQLNEVKQIINGKDESGNETIARQRDIQEVINYRDVVAYIEKQSTKLSEDTIQTIHKTILKNIMDDQSGSYRTEKAVTVNYSTGEKLNLYENAENIKTKVEDLLEWYNSADENNIHPVIKAALLHLEMVRIHPFSEGNGRLARALATLSLSVDGYDVNHFFCLDEYYDSNAGDYYDYLGRGFTASTDWIEYFALGMAIEFSRVRDRVLKISKDAKVKEKTGGQKFISERQEKIIEWLNDYSAFRNGDFDELFPDLSDDTVLRELKELIDNGIVKKTGKTKSSYYEFVN